MTDRRTLWLTGVAGLMLLLAGLGCGVCPLVPQPGPTHTPVSEVAPTLEPTEVYTLTPTLEPTEAPTLTPTQEPPPREMSMYADPLAGFSILYRADWMYEAEDGSVYFAENEEMLEYLAPVEGPMLAVMTVSPGETELEFGPDETAEDLLNGMLEGLLGGEGGSEIGEIETWTFGEIPGVGVEASWTDEWDDAQLHGYIIAAVGEEVVGFGFGTSPEADWLSYAPIFQDMFASLVFFPPELPEPVERGPIRSGEMVKGALPPAGVDIWYFEAEEEGYATIRLDAADLDALDPYLELYDEDGVIIAEDDDGGEGYNALIVDFPVAASGTYTIHALTYSGAGDYVLSLEVVEEPSGEVIEYGQMVEETLAENAQHGWFFQGVEGDVVTIAMNALDEYLDCYLELYGPNGIALTDDDDSGEGLNALVEYYELPADGVYRIVAGAGMFGAAGAYGLTLERTEMVIEGILTYGETMSATLEPGTRHHWLFEGEEGDVVTISMTTVTEDMDAYLELFAPDGMRVMTDDDSGGDSNAELSAFELPLGGTYRIIARGYDDGDVGEYELALTGP